MIDAIFAILTTFTTLTLQVVGHADLHPTTLHTFTTYPTLFVDGFSPVLTTAFAFDGGDAVHVVAGSAANPSSFAIVRVGDDVAVVEGPFAPFLRRNGVKVEVQ